MKPSIKLPLAVLVAQTIAASVPGPSTSVCCFHLRSSVLNQQVNEDKIGDLALGGPFEQARFCLDREGKRLKDARNVDCFMRAPNQQFACFPETHDRAAFDITPLDSHGHRNLTYNGSQDAFFACSNPDDEKNFGIFSESPGPGCTAITLALEDLAGNCAFENTTTVPASTLSDDESAAKQWFSRAQNRHPPVNSVSDSPTAVNGKAMAVGLQSSSPLGTSTSTSTSTISIPAFHSPTPSSICSISPSAPSIAPIKVVSFDELGQESIPNGPNGPAMVTVTYYNSTVMLYDIPGSFSPPSNNTKAPLCALQFRMPVCMDLPKGYPCYYFSGLEQEVLSESGMNFDLILDDGQATWNGTVLHQVMPGENIILGTFECGVLGTSDGGRKMGWRINSVRNFILEFLHAGVGSDAEFQDGIGAWIVPCQ